MDPKTGILLKLTAMLAFTVMSACVKGLDGAIPVGEVVFCRGFFALIPLCLWFIASSERITVPAAKNIGSLLAGSSAGLGGMFFGFLALAYLPLVNVTVLSYTTPLFTIMLAALLLREKVRIYRWSAVLTGFIGVFITLSPNLVFNAASGPARIDGVAMIGTALALTGALCAAFSSIAVRHLNSIEKPSRIVLIYTLTGVVAGLATLGFGWKMPDFHQFLLLAGGGLAGGIGQIAMTLSLRHAQASLLAPFDYTTMIWAIALGYLFMAEVPTGATIIGALTVIAAGLFAMWRENRLAKQAVREPTASAVP
ncbi:MULTISPECIES: DMT family transporter [Rhizobium/Agrobacterium group]|uniref:DMT family transporter n=1 Tax=Rhizobium/Agrobacterium group TaxID=227290 RepID=UPI00107F4212|nr:MULTISPECIES: DMT family transporter [Rhizobium/Agrobacterium group]MBB4402045.1 drug/metabolite transporter (DMT)-like permease [Agrobacterium radiobacter]MBB5587349.1 drug/metabolite transporter (DMT)-like permease [Agrobacterium radiobacter]NTB99311.1 DMT family transporter [Agrobacterium tumefaciens]TGE90071.1 EamA family transporter [Rhizobium sp. SEMIA 4032]